MKDIVIINNKNPDKRIKFDIKFFCGRGSPVGNTFNFRKSSSFETVAVGSIDEACDEMKKVTAKYMLDKRNMYPNSKKFREYMREILIALKSDKKVALECYCLNFDSGNEIKSGHRCHTYDYKMLIEKIFNEYPDRDFEVILNEWLNDLDYKKIFSNNKKNNHGNNISP